MSTKIQIEVTPEDLIRAYASQFGHRLDGLDLELLVETVGDDGLILMEDDGHFIFDPTIVVVVQGN